MCTTSQPKGQTVFSKRRSCSRSSHFLTVLLPVVMIICTTYLLKWRSSPLDTRWSTHHDPLQRRQLEQFYTTSSTTAFVSSGSGSPTTTATTPSLSSTPPLSSTPQTTSMSEQLIPTMPNGPPILPTPFPQAFDGGVAQNFSTLGCASFFANMTSSAPFRTCRPFSLLLGTSAAFINAQTNLTLLNSVIWGTCNTPTPYERCKSNMAWFATTIQTACSQELKDRNAMAVDALTGLQAFETLHTAGCLSDPTAHTYCYLTAALATNPFDVFLYGLPLGINLPKSSTPSCSACSKSILGVYADTLRESQSGTGNGGGPLALAALKETFGEALTICQTGCGQDFSLVGAGVNSSATRAVGFMRRSGWVSMAILVLGGWSALQLL